MDDVAFDSVCFNDASGGLSAWSPARRVNFQGDKSTLINALGGALARLARGTELVYSCCASLQVHAHHKHTGLSSINELVKPH